MDTSNLTDDEILDMYEKISEFIKNLEKSKISEEEEK